MMFFSRRYSFAVAFLFALVSIPGNFSPASAASASAKPEYILFLTADGFRTDYVEWYNPPNIKALIADGTRIIRSTNVFPAVTCPNMTSLVTGSYPRTTTISANSEYISEDDKFMPHPRHNKAETIAETLKKAGWKTASVNHFMLENRGADIYEAPGYDNTKKTAATIVGLIKKKDVHFIAAIFGATDHAGHQHGPHSDEVKAAVLGIDDGVGQIVRALKDAGIYDKTVIVFTADHGMSEYEKKAVSASPAETLKKAGFRVAQSADQLKKDTQVVVVPAGVQMVYFRTNMSAADKQKATQALAAIQGAEVLGREQLDALGCHNNHSGDIIVAPQPGYTLSNAGKVGGLHGRFSERNPILFFHGPGIKTGTVEGAQNIDVVPTLLTLVNVAPAKTVDGKPITAALAR